MEAVKLSGVGDVYSIGGCVAYEVSKRLSARCGNHRDHFWRRPTIALMSKPVSRFRFNVHALPKEFVNYFINDASAAHWNEIEQLPDNGTVIIDITRDLFTGVVELEQGAFIMNPLDATGIVAGLTPETMNREVLETVLKGPAKIISPNEPEQWSAFFENWKPKFDEFIRRVSRKFDKVILLEIYFTTNTISPNTKNKENLDESKATDTNALLKIMYDHIRDRDDVTIISIDKSSMMTGRHVAWDGPTYTHFVDETYALFCDSINSALSQSTTHKHEFLKAAAFAKAKECEELRTTVQVLQDDYKTALTRNNDLQVAITELEAEKAAIETATRHTAEAFASSQERLIKLNEEYASAAETARTETEEALHHSEQLEAQLAELSHTHNALAMTAQLAIADLAQRRDHLEQELAQAQRSLSRRTVKALARATYPLRSALGLAAR